jgi:hypothetical protein
MAGHRWPKTVSERWITGHRQAGIASLAARETSDVRSDDHQPTAR